MKCRIRKITIVWLTVFLAGLIGVFVFLWNTGIFEAEHSINVGFERMVWNGKNYTPSSGIYTEGKTIATDKNNDWKINEVKEDPSHTFVVARSFLDQYLFVSEDYTIPTSGKVTSVCWNGKYIKNKEFTEAISQIEFSKTTTFDYITEAIFVHNDTQCMEELYFAYENCPVATVNKGWLGKIKGEWVITTYISLDQYNEDGSPKPYMVGCYSIPNEYSQILEEYFIE